MAILNVTETQLPASMEIVSDVGCAGGNHRTITYVLDGVQKTLRCSKGELDTPADADEEARMVLLFVRLRRSRGKAEAGARII
jgi:hypothetical protein